EGDRDPDAAGQQISFAALPSAGRQGHRDAGGAEQTGRLLERRGEPEAQASGEDPQYRGRPVEEQRNAREGEHQGVVHPVRRREQPERRAPDHDEPRSRQERDRGPRDATREQEDEDRERDLHDQQTEAQHEEVLAEPAHEGAVQEEQRRAVELVEVAERQSAVRREPDGIDDVALVAPLEREADARQETDRREQSHAGGSRHPGSGHSVPRYGSISPSPRRTKAAASSSYVRATGNCGKSATTFAGGQKRIPACAALNIVVSL